jgi:uncharacterized membrane protein
MQKKGYLGKLFDLSFSELLIPKSIKILYIAAILCSIIRAVKFIIIGFHFAIGWGILAIILSPVVFLFMVICARIILEVILAVFFIAKDTTSLEKNTEEDTKTDTEEKSE